MGLQAVDISVAVGNTLGQGPCRLVKVSLLQRLIRHGSDTLSVATGNCKKYSGMLRRMGLELLSQLAGRIMLLEPG